MQSGVPAQAHRAPQSFTALKILPSTLVLCAESFQIYCAILIAWKLLKNTRKTMDPGEDEKMKGW